MPARKSKELHWGIIGCGLIANDFANALKCVPGCVLQACASEIKEQAERFHGSHGFQTQYTSHKDLVQDPKVEIVYVASLHVHHYRDVMLCLNNGKHVLCEKPMALNYKQAEELSEVARQKKLFLMEGMWTMCFPAIAKMNELLKSKVIGDIKQVIGDFGIMQSPSLERVWKNPLGGGGLMDFGCYLVAMSARIFEMEPPTRIFAAGNVNKDNIDLYGNIMIEYSNNRVSMLNYTVQANTPREIYICGTKGLIRLHRFFNCPKMVTLIKYLGNGDEERTRFKFELPEHITKDTESNYEHTSGFIYEIQSVKHALESKKLENPLYPMDESLFNAQVLEAVRTQIGVDYEKSELMAP